MANNNHFALSLDTLAPSGSITRQTEFINAQTELTITKGDASYMKIWFNASATGAKTDDGYVNGEWITATNKYTSEFSTVGQYYYHVVLMDDVRNESEVYNTEIITYDTTVPTVNSVELLGHDGEQTELVKRRDIKVKFTFSDNLSGAVKCYIDGDINEEDTAWQEQLEVNEIEAGEATRDIVLSGTGSEKATKTVTITVEDRSGNVSIVTLDSQDSIVLDTDFLTGDIILLDNQTDKNVITETWVNYQSITVELDLGDATAADVVGYKVWGDINSDGSATPTTEPSSYTSVTKGTDPIYVDKKLTSGDAAAKNVYAKVIDEAGNETTLDSVFVKYDATAPEVSIDSDVTHVSKVTGFTTIVITPDVDSNISGTASYKLYMNDDEFEAGSGDVPETFTVSSADLGDEGAKVFTLDVTDNAGNITTSNSVTVYLDTTAPSGSITMPAWLNGNFADTDHTTYPAFETAGAIASATDDPTVGAAGMAYMTCWCSTVAADTNVVGTQIAYKKNPAHSEINWTGHTESNSNYIHIQYVDAVGNAAIVHSAAFGIDTERPKIDVAEVKFVLPVGHTAYPTTAANLSIYETDDTSGVAQMRIIGDITDSTATGSWENYVTTRSCTLTTGDGMKTVKAYFKDVAGNVTEGYVEDEAELDTTAPSAILTLHQPDDDTAMPPYTNIQAFIAHFTGHDDSGTPYDAKDLKYKIYGDFNADKTAADARTATAEPEEWTQVVFETGKDYMKLAPLYATANLATSKDGETKTVYLKLMDNAENVTEATPQSFVYDTSAPEVVVSGVDYNRISKIHSLRLSTSGEIADKYADQINFTFTPDCPIIAYKVCAYLDQAAAEAGSHEDAAIPTTAGSSNMTSPDGYNNDAAVNAMIKGADYEAALGEVGEVDGAHFVVVYVCDRGGTWSVSAEFEVKS